MYLKKKATSTRRLEAEVTPTAPPVTGDHVNITTQTEVSTVDIQPAIEDFLSNLTDKVNADAGIVAGAEGGVSVEMPAVEVTDETPATVSADPPSVNIAMGIPFAQVSSGIL